MVEEGIGLICKAIPDVTIAPWASGWAENWADGSKPLLFTSSQPLLWEPSFLLTCFSGILSHIR